MHGAPADARYTTGGLEDIREHACMCVCVCVRACHVMSACDRLTGHYAAQGSRRDPLAKLASKKAIGRSLPGFTRRGWRPKRSPAGTVPDSMGDLGGQDGPKALQEASRRRTATRAKRYAHSGFGDKGAGSKGNRNIF